MPTCVPEFWEQRRSARSRSKAMQSTRGKLASITPAVDYLFHNAVTARTLADADRTYEQSNAGETGGEPSEPTDGSAESTEP